MARDVRWSAEEARAMDRWLVSRGFTILQLMGVAAQRVAEVARELIAAGGLHRVVFLVGPGNNGGDACVAEELLCGEIATVVWRPLDGDPVPDLDVDDLLVDGLFGVGLARALAGAARAAVEAVNDSGATVLAIDVPSGLSSDDGSIVGVTAADPDGGVAIAADHTVTFVGPKQGFFLGDGPALVGDWHAVDIGFPPQQAERWVVQRRRSGWGAAGSSDTGVT